ncbi:hypothetical protein ACOSP7_003466 [Xanthoceras sorbifolium]|uniref:Uncharacterized protein n=1 Tax=Xanthoceras sorbifolium TaxID=99658 RepID=A0ABQ8II32_9ROSI|nr:hypothetical protein JRO89_XS01G0030400 [Xanthoceras sorbifolium]
MMEEQGSAGHRVRRIITVTRRLQNHTIKLKCICDTHDNCDSEPKFVSWMPYHAVFGFLIPLLIAVLQVNNQGTNNYSFETHPTNLWAFLLATLVYCLAFAADIKYQFYNPRLSYAQLSRLVAVISGSLSSVSLISIFLPYLPGRLIFIVWASFSTVVSRSLIISLCRWLYYQMIMKTFFQVVGIWNRLKGSDLMEPPRLPV